MKHILDAVEGITLHCRDQLHQLLPLQQSNSSDGVGEIYDQLEVCSVCVCVCGRGGVVCVYGCMQLSVNLDTGHPHKATNYN